MDIVTVFKEYKALAEQLDLKVNRYCHCFSLLQMQYLKEHTLQEKVDPYEKEEIDSSIANLEVEIQDLFVQFLNYTNIVKTTLRQTHIIDFNIINVLNTEHIDTMGIYEGVIMKFKKLEQKYSDYNFKAVLDFSKMEHQKQQLDIAINEFNLMFSAVTKIRPLYSTNDCRVMAIDQIKQLLSEEM